MKRRLDAVVFVTYRKIDRPMRGVYLTTMKADHSPMALTAVNVRMSKLGYRVATAQDRLAIANAI